MRTAWELICSSALKGLASDMSLCQHLETLLLFVLFIGIDEEKMVFVHHDDNDND